ncbi:MAG: peptidyl-prolyl cis-trans isomerase, partial [candidate division Zixibacteria bacterium]|nr:peptidyl-prolyl cis-trans isomerase [candidate division Zixibacteria bacterium]
EKQSLFILQVNDTFFTNSHFIKYLQIRAGEDFKTLAAESLSRLFDDFVEEKILLEGAEKDGISLSDKEKHDYLDRLQRGVPSAEKNVLSDEHEIRSLFERILIEKFTSSLAKEITVTIDEIRSYYTGNKKLFLRSERVRVSQILCKTESDAIRVLKQVRNAEEAVFRQIALKESIGAEASRGGEMGVFEMNQLPFEMEKVIFSLKKGEVSDVLESMYGFHIFRLDEKLDAELMTQKEARENIRTFLIDQKVEIKMHEHLKKLKEDFTWKILAENLTFPYQRIQYE